MAQFKESFGEIEILSATSRLHNFSVGDKLELIFKPINEPKPPYQLKIWSPSGSAIVDKIIHSLPTGEPQSAAPYEFWPSAPGTYRIKISELRGRSYGETRLVI